MVLLERLSEWCCWSVGVCGAVGVLKCVARLECWSEQCCWSVGVSGAVGVFGVSCAVGVLECWS